MTVRSDKSVGRAWRRAVLRLQLLGTVAVLGWVPGNLAKLAILWVVWMIGFRRIARSEAIMMAGVNLLFAVMNLGALSKGIFRFSEPDILGMPVYEFFMWGFYALHTIRVVGARRQNRQVLAIVLASAFAVPFSTISDPWLLLLASGVLLAVGLVAFHEPADLAYAGYMLIVGALIEYVGVWTGQWSYPGTPYGGVPLWFATMWAGVGLYVGRLMAPMVSSATMDQAVR